MIIDDINKLADEILNDESFRYSMSDWFEDKGHKQKKLPKEEIDVELAEMGIEILANKTKYLREDDFNVLVKLINIKKSMANFPKSFEKPTGSCERLNLLKKKYK